MKYQVRLSARWKIELCLNYCMGDLFASETIYFDNIGSQIALVSVMTLFDNKEHLSSSVREHLKRSKNLLEWFRKVFQITDYLKRTFKLVFSINVEIVISNKTRDDFTISVLVNFRNCISGALKWEFKHDVSSRVHHNTTVITESKCVSSNIS